jgi:hypothetical protein
VVAFLKHAARSIISNARMTKFRLVLNLDVCKVLVPTLPRKLVRSRLWRPTVCAVFAGRNDDYLPDNEARIRAVIEWNTKVICDEIVFVEWNPVSGKELLSIKLTKDYPNVYAFIVPAEIHQQLCTNPKIQLMEYFAKNAGIRRAKSDYICATNADIIWDNNVRNMRYLLNEQIIFRTRRIELRWSGEALTQKYLRNPVNRIEFKYGWRQQTHYGCGDFTLAHRELWHKSRGYDESLRGSRMNCDGRGLLQLEAMRARIVHLGFSYHLHHQSSSTASGNSSQGESFEYWKNIPYSNSSEWGLGDCEEKPIGERIWLLQRK